MFTSLTSNVVDNGSEDKTKFKPGLSKQSIEVAKDSDKSTKTAQSKISSKPSILVMEDEKPLANALRLKLSNNGFNVQVAEDGKVGLELMKNNKYDLILLDLVMPVIDGFGVLEEMVKRGDETYVFVTSNLSQVEDKQRVEKLGVDHFFVKSDTSLAEIIDFINEFLNN